MKFTDYELWQEIKTFDKYGNSKREYELIQNIPVCLNEEHLEIDGSDNKVFIKSYTGITRFNQFELGENYRIQNSRHIFRITSFINSRLGQMILEEVRQ